MSGFLTITIEGRTSSNVMGCVCLISIGVDEANVDVSKGMAEYDGLIKAK